MTRHTDDALLLMDRALVSRDPLELALRTSTAATAPTFAEEREVSEVQAGMSAGLSPLR